MEAEPTNDQLISTKLLVKQTNGTSIEATIEPPPLLFSKRLLVAILLFFCYANFQILKNNINIAIVEMISNKSLIYDGEFNVSIRGREFDWDPKTIGVVTSVISYGSMLAFTSGFMINTLGGSVSCALCMFISGIMTILHPAALEQGFYTFLACRCLTGFFESAFYVSTSEISARWYPKKERTTLIAFAFNGTNIGTAVVFPLCGFLAHRWGWRMVFYVTGAISVTAALFIQLIVKNRPSQDKWITKKELAYILEETDDININDMKMNWPKVAKIKKTDSILKCMLTSGPLWALFIVQFSFIWLNTVFSASLPLYINDVTDKTSDEIGYISSIPNTVYIFMFPIVGMLIDYWKNHSTITMTRIHKILLSWAFISTSILFIATIFISNFILYMMFFVLIQISLSVVPLITSTVIVNLSPRYTSHVAAFSAIFFSLGAILCQIVTGFMTTNHSMQEWDNTFILAAGISVFGALIFVIYGSSETQKWS